MYAFSKPGRLPTKNAASRRIILRPKLTALLWETASVELKVIGGICGQFMDIVAVLPGIVKAWM